MGSIVNRFVYRYLAIRLFTVFNLYTDTCCTTLYPRFAGFVMWENGHCTDSSRKKLGFCSLTFVPLRRGNSRVNKKGMNHRKWVVGKMHRKAAACDVLEGINRQRSNPGKNPETRAKLQKKKFEILFDKTKIRMESFFIGDS